MTIQECYQRLGGDYAEVEKRLLNVKLVTKFITKFLDDDSFKQLCCEIQAGNRAEAFRMAHTLKGVCQNLGLKNLYISAEKLTEVLRSEAEEIPENAESLLKEVAKDYEEAVETIRMYLEEAGQPA